MGKNYQQMLKPEEKKKEITGTQYLHIIIVLSHRLLAGQKEKKS